MSIAPGSKEEQVALWNGEAFRPYVEGDAVRFVSACWIARARA